VLIIHEWTISLHRDQAAYLSGSVSSEGALIEPLTKLSLFLEFKAMVIALFQVE
jgi:phosphate starvation-inducible membrane PsiE